jgi:DNA-binding GntR family transcriptional regulator
VTYPTVADRTVERLRRMVITRELPPGALTSESRLAQILDCGRTPLREAVQRLSHEYLIRVRPRQGILIPELSIVEFQQAHEALLCLVVPRVPELAAARIGPSEITQLAGIVAEAEHAERAKDFFELTELDRRLHTAMAMATGNRYVADVVARIHGLLEPFVYASYEAAGSAGSSVAEHRGIVEALGSNDPNLAKQRFQDHIIDGRQRVLDLLGLGNFDPGR